jgi:uncharacterized membrane protein YcaP (DUF421 family)
MFDLSLPWWEFVCRAVIVYLGLMVMVRLSGKRTVGQFTPFDLLVVMLLSESVSNALNGEDGSVLGGLILATTLVVLNVLFSLASARSTRVEQVTEGTPVLVGRDGKIFEDVLKKERVGIGEIERALRQADCELADMKCAFLETDGNFSIMKKQG